MSKHEDSSSEHVLRHSAAHVFASAVMHIWPNARLGVGPALDNGFYYDVDLGDTTLSEDDFPTIEIEMKRIISKKIKFEKITLPIDDAIDWAKKSGQVYKLELLNDLKRAGTTIAKDIDSEELGLSTDAVSKVEDVTFYRHGDFQDLCRGPHVETTAAIGAFKLMKVAGAYWRGKDSNPQMQRVYGVAFSDRKKLVSYLNFLEEAKKRDHRKLGQELDLFVFSDLVGSGLPMFTPRGTAMRRQLDNFVQEMRDEYDYQEVSIPHITKKDSYIASGHWSKYQDELFKITTREGHEFAMKPMNCPHHAQIYASRSRSYKDLPIRYRETTVCYRDEQSGELSGLSRLRAFAQDDAHVFCRELQVEDEAMKIWDIVDRFYTTFGFDLRVRFSTHDPDAMDSYSGSEDKWIAAESQLLSIIKKKVGDDYIDGPGEAAFYGPKIDFLAKDAIGREYQVATIQLDFGQPEGFDLYCINEEGERERVVMVHAAIMGSIDRFMSVYIEHSAGRFPVWVAPEQLRVVTFNQDESVVAYAESIIEKAKHLGIRCTIDNSNESVSKKIRSAEMMKVPYSVVVGQNEVESNVIVPRVRRDIVLSDKNQMNTVEAFLDLVVKQATVRRDNI